MNRFVQISTAISVFFFTAFAYAGVTVSSPANGSTVGTSINIVATAIGCSKGVASMGIYPTPGWLIYTVGGASLNHTISLNPGTYNIVVQEWDYCGGASNSTVTVTVKSGSGVTVTSPANNSTVGSPVNFVASATSSCSKGVASMGIYTAPNQLAYTVNGSSLNTSLSLSAGTYNTTVTEWDYCGGAASTPVTITVSGSGGGTTLYNIQKAGGWASWAQQPPSYQDCQSCTPSGPGTTWAEYQGIGNPSRSGSSTEFEIGGTMAYSDVLWNNHLIGPFSSQGILDSNHTLVPTLYTFTYDVWFYSTNLNVSQALEFDVNQFFNSMGFTWGHECRVYAGNEWDVWDAANYKWVPTGIACNPLENSWNHLTIVVSRTSDNRETYQSITLNGVSHTLNWTYYPFSVPSDWWGVTINYQQDGNYAQQPYQIYVDNLNFTY